MKASTFSCLAWSSPLAALGPVLDRFRETEGLRRDGSIFPLELGVEAIAGSELGEQRFVLILQAVGAGRSRYAGGCCGSK